MTTVSSFDCKGIHLQTEIPPETERPLICQRIGDYRKNERTTYEMKTDAHAIGSVISDGAVEAGEDLADDLTVGVVIAAAEMAGNKIGLSSKASKRARGVFYKSRSIAKGVEKVGGTAVATGAAVTSATSLTVAATSGAGIATALAHAGAVVGGGMAAGPAVLAGGPAYLAAKGLNSTVFRDENELSEDESAARSAARQATNVGATAGVLGVGAATVAGGASGAAILGTLAAIGGVVGGGAIAGAAVLVAAPAAVAAAAGFGVHQLRLRKAKSRKSADVAKTKSTSAFEAPATAQARGKSNIKASSAAWAQRLKNKVVGANPVCTRCKTELESGTEVCPECGTER